MRVVFKEMWGAAVLVMLMSGHANAVEPSGPLADHRKQGRHEKAGPTAWNATAKVDTVVSATKTKTKPVSKSSPVFTFVPRPNKVKQRAQDVLGIANIAATVDFVPVLPGERIPLRASLPGGKTVMPTWRAEGGHLDYGENLTVWQAPLKPGIVSLTGHVSLDGRKIERHLSMVVLIPGANVKGGKLNGYPIGIYPRGYGSGGFMLANRGARDLNEVPPGFVELTRDNASVPISEHFKLGDFAGKDQWVEGRKYLMVSPRLVEKLEHLIYALRSDGYHVDRLSLLSGYRSPLLNEEIGNKTKLSRHTYGDAADVVVPDLNRDGTVSRTDAEILMTEITKLDKAGIMTGGGSIYSPNGAHGYFVHTDTRGTLIRW